MLPVTEGRLDLGPWQRGFYAEFDGQRRKRMVIKILRVRMAEKYRFYYPVKVRFVETDAQGHVFFGHYLTYFDVGLTEYMHAIGFSYQDLLAMGLDMFYVASDCQYHGRAYFDEVLHIHTCIGEIGDSSFTFQFAIYEKESDRLVTTGQIVAVVVDPETQKSVHVPEELRQAVWKYEE